ncbi:MAG: lipopolysaccharide heptosyltransferase I [Proteobacteria bacterium]|nr:lipopolysaccharide heptosyltransferase I [Pseudomonadota bacterium]
MLKILLVKMSSMGDLVHNLPAVTDIHAHYPGAIVDWVAEEAYVTIPSLHGGVRRVIPIAWRRWRQHLGRSATWSEMAEFRRQLLATDYDFVLDSQGLLKSAIVGSMAQGVLVGGDRESIREPFATLFYRRRLPISWSRHVVDRCRAVAAGVLGYAADTPPVYGISAPRLVTDWLPDAPYCVLMHAASRPEKLWSESHWIDLGLDLKQQGFIAVLPWGSAQEHERSRRLAQFIPGAVVPPLMNLETAAGFLAGSALVVGLDTGFTHFAAALGRPTIGIYCDSDSQQAAVFGSAYCASFGQRDAPPSYALVHAAVEKALSSSQ